VRLHFKEDPKEWRKVTLLSLIGPTVITCILRCRGVVSSTCLTAVLALVALVALCVLLRARWFRGYYRFTTRLGFYAAQIFGKMVLAALFFLVLTPLGWILRLMGKDLLQLKSPRDQRTFWQPARPDGSLDRMF